MGEGRTGAHRVIRGGSWNNNGRNVRSAYRNNWSPDNRNDNVGFRLRLAQRVIGINTKDQTFILTCDAQAKRKIASVLVTDTDVM